MQKITLLFFAAFVMFCGSAIAVEPNPDLDALFIESDRQAEQGNYDAAIHLADDVLKQAKVQYDKPNVYAAESYHRIAVSHYRLGRFSEAHDNFTMAEEEFKRLEFPEPFRAINLAVNMGEFYFNYGRYADALEKFQRVKNYLEVYPEAKDPILGRGLAGLATVYMMNGDMEKAETVYHEAIQLVEGTDDPKHVRSSSIMGLATIESFRRNFEKARGMLEELLVSLEARPDKDSAEMKSIINQAKLGLGNVLQQMGETEKAAVLLGEAMEEFGFGPEAPAAQVNADYSLALNLYAQEKYEEAKPLLEKIVREFEEKDYRDAQYALQPINSLALVYLKEQNYEAAEPLLKKAIELAGEAENVHVSHVCPLHNQLAVIYENREDYEEAESHYLKAISLCDEKWPDADQMVAIMVMNLADMYAYLERWEEAEKYSLKALAMHERSPSEDPVHHSETLYHLAAVNEQAEKYENAEKYYRQALAFDELHYGPESAETANVLNDLGAMYETMARYEEALSLHERALAIREKIFGPDTVEASYSLYNLGSVHESMGNVESARSFYEKALTIEKASSGNDSGNFFGAAEALARLKENRTAEKR